MNHSQNRQDTPNVKDFHIHIHTLVIKVWFTEVLGNEVLGVECTSALSWDGNQLVRCLRGYIHAVGIECSQRVALFTWLSMPYWIATALYRCAPLVAKAGRKAVLIIWSPSVLGCKVLSLDIAYLEAFVKVVLAEHMAMMHWKYFGEWQGLYYHQSLQREYGRSGLTNKRAKVVETRTPTWPKLYTTLPNACPCMSTNRLF